MNRIIRILLLGIAGWLYFQFIFRSDHKLSSVTLIVVGALLLMGMESIKRKKDKVFKVQSDAKAIAEMSKENFVVYMAELFKRLDYFVEPVNSDKKKGTDLIIRKGTQVICVRCEVGRVESLAPLQEFYGSLRQYPSKKSLVVCNDYFGDEAIVFAKLNKIQVLDKRQLVKMITQVLDQTNVEELLETQEI